MVSPASCVMLKTRPINQPGKTVYTKLKRRPEGDTACMGRQTGNKQDGLQSSAGYRLLYISPIAYIKSYEL